MDASLEWRDRSWDDFISLNKNVSQKGRGAILTLIHGEKSQSDARLRATHGDIHTRV